VVLRPGYKIQIDEFGTPTPDQRAPERDFSYSPQERAPSGDLRRAPVPRRSAFRWRMRQRTPVAGVVTVARLLHSAHSRVVLLHGAESF